MSEGPGRAGDAVLFACGGRTVTLRLAVPASSQGDELGLTAPALQDVELGPAVLRVAARELLVSARAAEALVGSQGAASVSTLLDTSQGVVVDGTVYAVVSVASLCVGGTAMCYRVALRAMHGEE